MRWLYANLAYKLIAVAVAFLLWGVAHSSSSVERGFDVPMVLRGIPDDLVIVDQSSDEVNIRIQGSRAAIRNISAGDLEYPVEVAGAKPGVLTVDVDPTLIQLPRGALIVSRSPSRVDLTLARRGSKAVKVRVDLTGEPNAELRVAEVVVDPPRVRVTGAQAEVLRLGEVLTETIDITGASADLEKEVGIALTGSHVWLEEVGPVKVQVRFAPAPPDSKAGGRAPARREPKAQGGKARMTADGTPLFGTDGVRGTANVHPMTAEMALALGQAIAHVFRSRGGATQRILIGKDTRLSGYMFEDALAAGICSMGAEVIQVGPMPTPAMAFLTVDMRCKAGVMISASHNPYQDNGIKFFGHDGFKLPDELERRIEELIASGELATHRADPDEIGRATRIEDAAGRYIVFLKKTFPVEYSLEGVRVVLDCANGAAYRVGPTMLHELGAEVFPVGIEPNGRNINHECGSLFPEKLAAKVRELRADVGIAVDGDADRCVMVDERGEVIDGDATLALCARDLAERGKLRGGAVVATIMSNLGLERALERQGIRLVRTKVGDRYVVEEMRAGGYNLGGEQSGHIIFLDHNTTGDGLLTGLQTLAILRRKNKPLSELVGDIERFPQVLLNVTVAEKRPIESMAVVCDAVRKVEAELAGRGRVLIRYSGTEPKIRIMVEGEDEDRVNGYARDLADLLRRALGGEA